ncbi:MAG: carboxypeptidase regulatory-like domain-containing protein [Acidobacteria bacterium]|nr:carboxypeptidase regulatory-like domain-containing protein [Acidobacteriota bacterium]
MKLLRLAPVLVAVALLRAQSGDSSVSGAVKDPAGSAIPAANITVVNIRTGVQQATFSNDSGLYRVGGLVPGSYRVEVDAVGFDHLVRGPVAIEVSRNLALDIALQVGKQSEIVTVTEGAPLVDSQSSTVAQTVNQRMLDGLPLPNRAASSLAALAPGVVMIDSGAGTAENYPVFSVAGGRARNQSFTLDGGNVSNAVGLTRPQQLTSLPVDAMQEFKIIANTYSAEYGHSTGGIVTMSTRSGSNEYHGTLFESLQNDAVNARNYFAAKRAPVRLNQYGGTFGGPIRRDKTHFFVSWEQTRQLTSFDVTSTVPTALNRVGDFSDLRSTAGRQILIYDPASGATAATRQPFAGSVIPLARFDAVSRAALAYLPAPNRAGTATNANNFFGSSRNELSRNIVVGRLDHQLRPADLITARYYINDANTNNSGTYGIPAADPLADITDVRIQSILGAYTHVFSPTLTNDFRFTYLRRKFLDWRPGAGENLAAKIGLSGVSDAAFPAFTIPGYGVPAGFVAGNVTVPSTGATLGNPTAVARIQTPITDRQFIDSISWFRGRHAFKFGGEYRMGANDEIRDRGSAGVFTISPQITDLPGSSSTTGNSLASFLLGEVNAASIQVSDKIPSRASYMAFYFQDDWRVTDRLTVNAGLRYEVEFPRWVVGNKMNSFDPTAINPVSGTPGVVTFAGVNGTPTRAFATDWNNLGPRLGFAYKLPGASQTVIRGGAGFFYGPTVSNTIGDVASLGFSTSASYAVSQAETQSVFQLRSGFPAVTRQAIGAGFGAVPLGQKVNTSVAFFNPKQAAPISYQYNFSVQREVARDLLVEAGYIGNVSHHLTANDFTLNQVPPQLMTTGNAQLARPFPQFNNVTWINPSIGNSTYHAGFLRAEKRMSGGLSLLAHLTFSKFIDDVEAANEFGATGSYMDAYNRRLDKGLSGSDVPRRLVVTLLYELPSYKGSRILNAVAGGWKLGVLQTAESGPTFTVISTANTTNAFPAGSPRPNLLADAALPGDQRNVRRWFDTSAFANPAALTFGNSPRGGFRAAPVISTDATFEKSFALTERWRADVRGEFYNLLNHAIFNIPGFTLGAADFGAVSSARSPRTAQLSLRLSF